MHFHNGSLNLLIYSINGTYDDVEVITHETGHAFAFYIARNIVPRAYQSPTLDACEIHSMTYK